MDSVVGILIALIRSNLVATLVCVLLVYVVVTYGYGPFNYWKNLGVPYEKVKHPFIGNYVDSVKKCYHEVITTAYRLYPNERFVGIYMIQKPVLVLRDPQLIEAVLIKDFAKFSDRGTMDDPSGGKLRKHLFNLKGEHWKNMRSKLTPTFSASKLKGMQPQLVECADSLLNLLNEFGDGRPFEIRDVITRFSMDVVASCAFGLSIDTINQPDSKIKQLFLTAFEPSARNKLLFSLRTLPLPLLKLACRFIPERSLNSDFFINVINSTLDYRKTNNIVRPDFLHLMNEIRMKERERIYKKELDPNDLYIFDDISLYSNAFIFFLAGFETSSATISYCMYHLTINPEVQDKLYSEICSVLKKYNGEVSYNAVQEMLYLEQVINETLRLCPPGSSVDRKVCTEYPVPGSDLILTPAVNVLIPIYALHHDPQYYPEPEKFLPERFAEGKRAIPKGCFLPFGDGPKSCIAAKFAMLEIKVAVTMMIEKYKFIPCKKTVSPLKYDPKSFLLIPEGGIWVSIQPRTKM